MGVVPVPSRRPGGTRTRTDADDASACRDGASACRDEASGCRTRRPRHRDAYRDGARRPDRDAGRGRGRASRPPGRRRGRRDDLAQLVVQIRPRPLRDQRDDSAATPPLDARGRQLSEPALATRPRGRDGATVAHPPYHTIAAPAPPAAALYGVSTASERRQPRGRPAAFDDPRAAQVFRPASPCPAELCGSARDAGDTDENGRHVQRHSRRTRVRSPEDASLSRAHRA